MKLQIRKHSRSTWAVIDGSQILAVKASEQAARAFAAAYAPAPSRRPAEERRRARLKRLAERKSASVKAAKPKSAAVKAAKPMAAPKNQHQLQRATDPGRRHRAVYETLHEMQTGPNPLSEAELEKLAKRQPHYADVVKTFKKASKPALKPVSSTSTFRLTPPRPARVADFTERDMEQHLPMLRPERRSTVARALTRKARVQFARLLKKYVSGNKELREIWREEGVSKQETLRLLTLRAAENYEHDYEPLIDGTEIQDWTHDPADASEKLSELWLERKAGLKQQPSGRSQKTPAFVTRGEARKHGLPVERPWPAAQKQVLAPAKPSRRSVDERRRERLKRMSQRRREPGELSDNMITRSPAFRRVLTSAAASASDASVVMRLREDPTLRRVKESRLAALVKAARDTAPMHSVKGGEITVTDRNGRKTVFRVHGRGGADENQNFAVSIKGDARKPFITALHPEVIASWEKAGSQWYTPSLEESAEAHSKNFKTQKQLRMFLMRVFPHEPYTRIQAVAKAHLPTKKKASAKGQHETYKPALVPKPAFVPKREIKNDPLASEEYTPPHSVKGSEITITHKGGAKSVYLMMGGPYDDGRYAVEVEETGTRLISPLTPAMIESWQKAGSVVYHPSFAQTAADYARTDKSVKETVTRLREVGVHPTEASRLSKAAHQAKKPMTIKAGQKGTYIIKTTDGDETVEGFIFGNFGVHAISSHADPYYNVSYIPLGTRAFVFSTKADAFEGARWMSKNEPLVIAASKGDQDAAATVLGKMKEYTRPPKPKRRSSKKLSKAVEASLRMEAREKKAGALRSRMSPEAQAIEKAANDEIYFGISGTGYVMRNALGGSYVVFNPGSSKTPEFKGFSWRAILKQMKKAGVLRPWKT